MKLRIHKANALTGHDTSLIEVEEAASWDYAAEVIAVQGTHVKSYQELLEITQPLELQGVTETEVFIIPQMAGG